MSTGNAARSNFGHSSSLQPGDVVGENYRIIDFIGEGAMGKVYRAKHELMPREYALKILNERDITENSWRRFQVEAQAIARLSHPNVVTIYNLGVHNGTLPYYVMDLLDGETLYDRLNREENLEYKDALPLFMETCDGLGYAHKKGIVHRDIKPQNIVILKQQENGAIVRIVDFGIAKLAETKDPKNQMLTQMGEVFGTPFYMSPEQSMGERVDGRSDIYSLGCTLYETLCGTPPYRGINAGETMLMHQDAPIPSIQKACGFQDIPEDLETVINKMLAKEPMDRYQSMEALKHDLMLVMDGKPLSMLPYMPFTPTGTGASFDAVGRNTSGMTTSGRSTTDRSTSGYSTSNRSTTNSLSKEELVANATTRKFRRNEEPSGQEYTMPPDSGPGLKIAIGIALAAIIGTGVFAVNYFTPKTSAPKMAGDTFITDAVDGPSGYKPPGSKASESDGKSGNQSIKVAPGTNSYAKSVITGSGTLQPVDDVRDPLRTSGHEYIEALPDIMGSGYMKKLMPENFNPKDPKCSIHDKEKYCTIKTINGVRTKVFNFPEDIAIGGFRLTERIRPELASGKIEIPCSQHILFGVGPLAKEHKEYMDRFRPGDVEGIFMDPSVCGDPASLKIAVGMPKISIIDIARCKQIDDKSVHLLTNLSSVNRLDISYTSITGPAFASKANLHKYIYLGIAEMKNPAPVLRGLRNSKDLTILNVSNCILTKECFDDIGTLPNLHTLFINDVDFPTGAEKGLSRLRNLKVLSFSMTKRNIKMLEGVKAHLPELELSTANKDVTPRLFISHSDHN